MFLFFVFFCCFFNDGAPTEFYPLPLHDALPISAPRAGRDDVSPSVPLRFNIVSIHADRKSTRLNSSYLGISYAVFCLKKENPTCRLPDPVAGIRGIIRLYY